MEGGSKPVILKLGFCCLGEVPVAGVWPRRPFPSAAVELIPNLEPLFLGQFSQVTYIVEGLSRPDPDPGSQPRDIPRRRGCGKAPQPRAVVLTAGKDLPPVGAEGYR